MRKRALRKVAARVRCVSVSAPTAVVLVFLVAFLLQCGDVEMNPGPNPKTRQSTLSQSSPRPSPSSDEKAKTDKASIDDVVKMLSALDEKMTTMDKKMDSIHSTMQERMDKLQDNFDGLVKENRKLQEKVENLENKLDDVEGRSRRNNLIFHGIPHPQGQPETWADCEKAVRKVIREELGIKDDVEIERAHRLRSGKTPHPIIVCFGSFKAKERILEARRTLRNKKSAVFVSEDFTPRVRDVRRKLLPFLKEAKNANKKAFLRFDTLVIDGKTFLYDPAKDGVVERQRRQ